MEKDKGTHFWVDIYDDYVIKKPRRPDKAHEDLKQIAEMSTKLSIQVPEVLPCRYENGDLIQPRAQGTRMNKEHWQGFGIEMAKRLSERIESAGYFLSELNQRNLFYNEKTKKLEVVDLHTLDTLGLRCPECGTKVRE